MKFIAVISTLRGTKTRRLKIDAKNYVDALLGAKLRLRGKYREWGIDYIEKVK